MLASQSIIKITYWYWIMPCWGKEIFLYVAECLAAILTQTLYIPAAPPSWQSKMSPDINQCPLEATSAPDENQHFTGTREHYLNSLSRGSEWGGQSWEYYWDFEGCFFFFFFSPLGVCLSGPGWGSSGEGQVRIITFRIGGHSKVKILKWRIWKCSYRYKSALWCFLLMSLGMFLEWMITLL